MKKKGKQLFKKTVAMIMALLTAASIFPTSVAMAATEKATITFEYAYDSKGNTIHYQKTITHDGITCGHAGEARTRIYEARSQDDGTVQEYKQYVSHVLRYYPFGRVPTGIGNQAIVQVALSQEGNVGGQSYWSWYGFDSRVEWCACFVSWCAEQCGYIDTGIIPKFSLCSDGVNWFASRGQFQDGSYVPVAGDIIFFDWQGNGDVDHVGIIESVVNGTVYTIEGNSGDVCRRRSYSIGYDGIYGYGIVIYK